MLSEITNALASSFLEGCDIIVFGRAADTSQVIETDWATYCRVDYGQHIYRHIGRGFQKHPDLWLVQGRISFLKDGGTVYAADTPPGHVTAMYGFDCAHLTLEQSWAKHPDITELLLGVSHAR